MEILQQFVIAMVVAVGVGVFLTRIRISPLIGFLMTGILIGPYGLNLVHSAKEIEGLAEVGVMLLMFTIGLEFSVQRILLMRHEVLVLGSLQIAITASLVFAVMRFFLHFTWQESSLAAFVVSMSSTAVVLKSLQDKGQLQSAPGRIMTGILLFQDLCVVPLMILLPLMGKLQQVSSSEIVLKMALAFVSIPAIFYVSKFLLPKVFDIVCGARVNELFMMLVLALCFGLSILTSYMGFSLALGAFIAGMILAESDFIYQIEADIKPLKNVFLSVFFISVGMLLNISFVWENIVTVSLVAVMLIMLKTVVIAAILILYGNPVNVAGYIGLGLAQIGEFSFMLLNMGYSLQIVRAEYYQLFLSASLISMMFTPLFLTVGEVVHNQSVLKQGVKENTRPQPRVVIAGYGVNGQNLSKILKSLSVPYTIIEINPHTVKKYKKEGEDIVFGDVTRQDNLLHLGIDRAFMMIVAISDWEASLRAVTIARRLNPSLKIIVRTEFVKQIEPLYMAGADVVISQEFEASLEIAAHVLRTFGIASSIIRLKAAQLRRRHYGFFTRNIVGPQSKIAELASIVNLHEMYTVLGNTSLAGRNIGVVKNLLHPTGVAIVAVLRGNEVYQQFSDDFLINERDSLLLYGPQNKIDEAIERLDNADIWQ